jgi:origin recognition complex subunit 1
MASRRPARSIPGVTREDSDDELGDQDLPWEWVYSTSYDIGRDVSLELSNSLRKRKSNHSASIVGARMGDFECGVGDTVLLKAEGSNEAWVAIICEFIDGDDGEMAANFMWFSTEKEIRLREKKRTDFYWVRSAPFLVDV